MFRTQERGMGKATTKRIIGKKIIKKKAKQLDAEQLGARQQRLAGGWHSGEALTRLTDVIWGTKRTQKSARLSKTCGVPDGRNRMSHSRQPGCKSQNSQIGGKTWDRSVYQLIQLPLSHCFSGQLAWDRICCFAVRRGQEAQAPEWTNGRRLLGIQPKGRARGCEGELALKYQVCCVGWALAEMIVGRLDFCPMFGLSMLLLMRARLGAHHLTRPCRDWRPLLCCQWISTRMRSGWLLVEGRQQLFPKQFSQCETVITIWRV